MATDEISAQGGDVILVIRLSSLGDVLLTAPALRALRKRFPTAHIDFLVASEFADAANLLPGPDRILLFDRQSGLRGLRALQKKYFRCYDIVVDLQNSLRSAFLRTFLFPTIWVKARRHRIRRWFLIHFKWDFYPASVPVSARYLRAVEFLGAESDGLDLNLESSKLESSEGAPVGTESGIVLCPGAKHFTKRWPEERWTELGILLRRAGYKITVVGAAEEANLVRNIASGVPEAEVVVGVPLPRIAELFRNSLLIVSSDSGLMHLAEGVGTPLAAIFGPTIEQFGFFPQSKHSVVLENEVTCRPCSAFGGERCPKKHFRCMLETTPCRVYDTVLDLIQHKSEQHS